MKCSRTHIQQATTGLAVVEFALVLPLLLVFLFGVIDFGRVVLIKQVMVNLSREASNLSSRGTSLPDVVAAIQMSAAPLDLKKRGYLIITEVERDINGVTSITDQISAGDKANPSRVGSGIGNAASLPVTTPPIPLPGLSMFVAEVFYVSPPITPLGRLVDISLGETFYDAAYF